MKTYLTTFLFYSLSITSILGHVNLNYPIGGESFNSGSEINIQWYNAIDHGDCDWDLYFSPDNGNTWQEIYLDINKSQLDYSWTIPNSLTGYGKIKVVQDNFYYNDYESVSGNFIINPMTTGIIYENISPNEFLIYSAYPNPFNSSTVISFYLPEHDQVKIDIYNLVGQKIKRLTDKEMSDGLHKVNWNADDLTSGIYFYSIETKRFTKVGRAILIK